MLNVTSNAMNVLLMLHAKTLLWHYQDTKTKLGARRECVHPSK